MKLLKNKNFLYIILCAGVLLLVLGSNFQPKAEDTYETALENKIASTLQKIDGVGKVSVMVCTASKGDDYFNKGTNQVEGVVVVAQGAENDKVRNNIYEATSALTGAPIHKIKIFSKKSEE